MLKNTLNVAIHAFDDLNQTYAELEMYISDILHNTLKGLKKVGCCSREPENLFNLLKT
jgi:hypothetical protein